MTRVIISIISVLFMLSKASGMSKPVIIYYGVLSQSTGVYNEWYYVYHNDSIYFDYTLNHVFINCEKKYDSLYIYYTSRLDKLKKRIREEKPSFMYRKNETIYTYKFLILDVELKKITCRLFDKIPFNDMVVQNEVYQLSKVNSFKIIKADILPPYRIFYSQ